MFCSEESGITSRLTLKRWLWDLLPYPSGGGEPMASWSAVDGVLVVGTFSELTLVKLAASNFLSSLMGLVRSPTTCSS